MTRESEVRNKREWKDIKVGDRVRIYIGDESDTVIESVCTQSWNDGQIVGVQVLGIPFSAGNYSVEKVNP